MAEKVDYSALAKEIIDSVGGEENVNSLIHCITRLRFYLKDEDIANTEKIKSLNGVIDVRKAQGQYQVVIGSAVEDVYDEAIKQLGSDKADPEATAAVVAATTAENQQEHQSLYTTVKNSFNDLIGFITGSMSPIVGALAAAGITKGLLALLTMQVPGVNILPLISSDSITFTVINAMGDAIFVFLPIMVGVTAARKLGSDIIIGATIGGVLVHPSLLALVAGKAVGETPSLLSLGGFDIPLLSYTYSIFPMILAVFLAAKMEKFLKRVLPNYLRLIFVPLITIFVISGITLYVTGPIILGISNVLAHGIQWLLQVSGPISGFIIGGIYQLLVIFGLHWGLAPIALNDFATLHYSLWNAIISTTMIGQGAAVLAVALKTKKTSLRELGIGATISAFAGVTEPAIYGINLKYRRVFISGLIGSAFGGLITGLFHGKMWGWAGSWIGFASFINPDKGIDQNFWIFLAASLVTTIVGFLAAYFWGYNDNMIEEQAMAKPKKP